MDRSFVMRRVPRFVWWLAFFASSLIWHAAQGKPDAAPDEVTEVEALRYENALLKAQRAQVTCEAACAAQIPDYKKAQDDLRLALDAIAKVHRMDLARGDRFDLATRAIVRVPATPKK